MRQTDRQTGLKLQVPLSINYEYVLILQSINELIDQMDTMHVCVITANRSINKIQMISQKETKTQKKAQENAVCQKLTKVLNHLARSRSLLPPLIVCRDLSIRLLKLHAHDRQF